MNTKVNKTSLRANTLFQKGVIFCDYVFIAHQEQPAAARYGKESSKRDEHVIISDHSRTMRNELCVMWLM